MREVERNRNKDKRAEKELIPSIPQFKKEINEAKPKVEEADSERKYQVKCPICGHHYKNGKRLKDHISFAHAEEKPKLEKPVKAEKPAKTENKVIVPEEITEKAEKSDIAKT